MTHEEPASPPPRRRTGRVPEDVLVHLRRARDKYHFLRLFRRTYGRTPGVYLSERRVERAQDLLRATNLTVTEVCHAVGFSSLGSFSSRFREITGESPSQSQRRYAATGTCLGLASCIPSSPSSTCT